MAVHLRSDVLQVHSGYNSKFWLIIDAYFPESALLFCQFFSTSFSIYFKQLEIKLYQEMHFNCDLW